MQVNIIVPYRPLSLGHLSSPPGEQHQLPDGSWTGWGDKSGYDTAGVRDLFLTIKFLNKNSVFKHKIIVAIDSDVYPNDNFLKEFENVTVIKSSYICKETSYQPYWRLNAAYKDAINSIPDEEWICHGFTADLVCSKNWDQPVMDAISQYGDNYVYVPMFVEVYSGWFNGINFKGSGYTPNLIWDEWRKKVCCHALTIPEPEKGYVTEQDFDEYIKVANEAKKGWVIERPGDRVIGYYNVMFMKAKHAKKAMRLFGPSFDIDFDNRLFSECKIMKVVITNSFVLHPVVTPFKEV